MAKRRKTLSLLIIPDGEQQTFTLKFRYGLLKTLFVFLVIFFFVLIFGTISYWKLVKVSLDYRRIESENQKLLADNARINQIAEESRRVNEILNRVRNIMGDKVDIEDEAGSSYEQRGGLSSSYTNPIYRNYVRRSPDSFARSDILSSYPTFLPIEGPISRTFKKHVDYAGGGHFGIDIVAPELSVVRAAGDGIVLIADWTVDSGHQLMIDHLNGYITIYKHNASLLVQERQFVRQGDPVTLLGNSGESTAPHLHFEVWKDFQPVDPFTILPQKDRE